MTTIDSLAALCAALAAAPALDAFGRWLRLAWARAAEFAPTTRPSRLLVLVPSRAEGARVLGLCRDLAREASLCPDTSVSVRVILDGADDDTGRALAAEGFRALVKTPAGPTKGAALRFAGERLAGEVEPADFVMVFDADMRLAPGFFSDLAIPDGAEAFQLPVRPAGTPPAGAPRVEAFSLAVATRVEDLERDARGLPVRLRGKAMGLSPRAFRIAASATRTTAEDSEATLALLARGIRVRALAGPLAFDEPASTSAMGAPRARWLAGHMKLLLVGFPDLLRVAVRRPWAAFVLTADLFLRPRALLFPAVLAAFLASTVLLYLAPSPLPVTAVLLAGGAILFEMSYLVAARRAIGFPEDVPRVAPRDLLAAAAVWLGAVARAIVSPGRWHRARPEVTGSR